MSNQILPFCPTDTGTNLESQADYIADTNRTNGNQPGVASSKLNNKAIRQATFVASQVAQSVADLTGTDVLDDGVTAKLLAQLKATIQPMQPIFTAFNSATTGTHAFSYYFFIATGSATAAATYTNNGVTFTVAETVASGKLIRMTAVGTPTASGTLTKASGTGDATLTFYAVRAPIQVEVELIGGGGGGAGASTANDAGAGGTGGTTYFGSAVLSANGGLGGAKETNSDATTTFTLTGTGVTGYTIQGVSGGYGVINNTTNYTLSQPGGWGGSTKFGGGAGWVRGGSADSARANTGAGGGGGGGYANTTWQSGGGGSAGLYLYASVIGAQLATWLGAGVGWQVGAGGTAGAAGTGGNGGGVGGSGTIHLWERFQ